MSKTLKIIQLPVKIYSIAAGKRYMPQVTKFAKKFYKNQIKTLTVNSPIRKKKVKFSVDISEKPAQRLLYDGVSKYVRALSKHLEDANVFVDVGACYGEFSLPIAQAYPNKKIIALEPHPKSASLLKQSVALNKLNNFRIVHAAASNTKGSSHLEVQQGNVGWSKVSKKGIEIEKTTLDKLIDDKIVLKIDTEGHELAVLKGMKNLLKQKKVIAALIEIQVENEEAIFKLMKKAGLRLKSKKNNDFLFVNN